jgi:hypothetical protein
VDPIEPGEAKLGVLLEARMYLVAHAGGRAPQVDLPKGGAEEKARQWFEKELSAIVPEKM